MNRRIWLRRHSAFLLVMALSLASEVRASETPGPEHTARVLKAIEKRRLGRAPADLRAARELNADGDNAYREGDYSKAHTYYLHSTPNYPNAYAYIMTGDSHWRGVVRFQEKEARKPENRPPACPMDNKHFVGDLALDLAQDYEVGLALAKRENDRRFLQSTLYRRARESATCLQEVARFYETQPPTACVDIAKLRQCLGAPLIK